MVKSETHNLDAVFHALADPTRRAMLRRLGEGEHSAGELAAPCEMSLAAASKHIRRLEQAGLVRRRVAGRTHWFSLQPRALADAHQWLAFYERFWSDRLDALDQALQSGNDT